jgi:hypothetical protein
MLEFYFSYRGVLKRLRSGALGAEMDRIASYFSSLGCGDASLKQSARHITVGRSARPPSPGSAATLDILCLVRPPFAPPRGSMRRRPTAVPANLPGRAKEFTIYGLA